MPVGAALTESSSGEYTTHFSTIRIRATGEGFLRPSVFSLDDVRSKALHRLEMSTKARYALTRIVNFVEQRASFEIKTIDQREKFRINRIVIFTKQIYKSYPGS